MLVKELIEELQRMNPNYDVYMLVSDGITDYESKIENVIKDGYRRNSILLISPINN